MKKKICSLLLAVVMLSSMTTAMGYFNYTEYDEQEQASWKTEGDYRYKVLPDGTVEIMRLLNDLETDVVIPSTIAGRTVTVIGEEAFSPSGYYFYPEDDEGYYKPLPSAIRSIAIPDTIKKIKANAFYHCDELKEVVVPDSVTDIGEGAFVGCDSLETFKYGAGMTTVDGSIFGDEYIGCKKLKSLTLPPRLTTIKGEVIPPCEIESLEIPATVTNIVFEFYYKTFPLKTASGKPFKVTIDKDNPSYKIENNAILSKDGKTFYRCIVDKVGRYTVPDGVTNIEKSAFYEINIRELILPEGITRLNEYVISNYCIRKLSLPDSLTTIEKYAINISARYMTYPKNVEEITQAYFGNELREITIKGGRVQKDAFVNEDKMKKARVYKNVTLKPYSLGYTRGDRNRVKIKGFTIAGYKNSPAHKYAKKYGFKFETLKSLKKAKATIKKRLTEQQLKNLAPKVKLNGKKLRKGRDYRIEYTKDNGKARVRIIGMGRYIGAVNKTVAIKG